MRRGYKRYEAMPLTFRITSPGNIRGTMKSDGTLAFKYKKDDKRWATSMKGGGGGPGGGGGYANVSLLANVSAGTTYQFMCVTPESALTWDNYFSFSGSTCGFIVEGNVMSLVYGPDFPGKKTPQQFTHLFEGCTGLTDASNLILPSEEVLSYGYEKMFTGCNSLTVGPELPATMLYYCAYRFMFNGSGLVKGIDLPNPTLSDSACYAMYEGCIHLTVPPKLPSTNLYSNCYRNMFLNCTSLTDSPELNAGTLKSQCYHSMFKGCTNLTAVTCNATTEVTENNLGEWLRNVCPSGTFYTEDESKFSVGYNGIPEGWIPRKKSLIASYAGSPLTFKVSTAGRIVWHTRLSTFTPTIQYKKNSGSWTNITPSTGNTSYISVAVNDTVQFRGENERYAFLYDGKRPGCDFSGTTCKFEVYGNIMSLLDKENYDTKTDLNTYAFLGLFSGVTNLTDARYMLLPATTLANDCYHGMFAGCTNLIFPSDLPSVILADQCYYQMFYGCTNLHAGPLLPSRNLFYMTCYFGMFYGCTSLLTAPFLPASYIPQYCYGSMFQNCSSLSYIKCLATGKASTNSTQDWVSEVAQSGTFCKHPDAKHPDAAVGGALWPFGTGGIPSSWTIVDA